MEKSILVVDANPHDREMLVQTLKDSFAVTAVGTAEEALRSVSQTTPDLLLLDYHLEGGGKTLFRRLQYLVPNLKAIVLAGEVDIEGAVTMTKLGANDFLSKPLDLNRLKSSVNRVLAEGEISFPIEKVGEIPWLEGRSAAREKFLKDLEAAGSAREDIFLFSERGIPKDPVVEIFHLTGVLRTRKLIRLDLLPFEINERLFWSTLQELLAEVNVATLEDESDLCGTLYLENFESLPEHFQKSILEFASRRRESLNINPQIRLIIGLENRLPSSGELPNFCRLTIPPLRQRGEDLPLILNAYLGETCRKLGKDIRGVSREALEFFTLYPWPGNVDELAGVLETAVLNAKGESINWIALPLDQRMLANYIEEEKNTKKSSLLAAKQAFEKKTIGLVRQKTGNLDQTAKLLNLPKSRLREPSP